MGEAQRVFADVMKELEQEQAESAAVNDALRRQVSEMERWQAKVRRDEIACAGREALMEEAKAGLASRRQAIGLGALGDGGAQAWAEALHVVESLLAGDLPASFSAIGAALREAALGVRSECDSMRAELACGEVRSRRIGVTSTRSLGYAGSAYLTKLQERLTELRARRELTGRGILEGPG